MHKMIALTVMCVLLLCNAAQAAVYSENWNIDPGPDLGGWTDTAGGGAPGSMTWSATGGMDNSGHLTATRATNYPPYFNTANDPVKSATGGNVNTTFGQWVNISLDIKIEDGDPPDEIGYGWWIYDMAGGVWHINLESPGAAPADWTNYSVTFDTTWSDTEANTHGFYNFSSPSSWSTLMTQVQEWYIGARALNFSSGGPYTTHVDNFKMETTTDPGEPEPGTKTYSEDWNTDPGIDLGGWTGDGLEWASDGGPDGSGHLKAYRASTYLPYMRTTNNPVQSEVGDDVYLQYGQNVRISVDALIEDENPPDEVGYGWWIFDAAGKVWYKELEPAGSSPDEWTKYTEEIDTLWSDTDANANGWFSSDSTISWAALMRNVQEWNFMGRGIANKGGGGYTGHLDNLLMESIGDGVPGDFNDDGAVDVTDLGILATNYGTPSDATLEMGDANGDGAVDVTDLGILATNYGTVTTAATVPEPAVISLLLCGLASLALIRRR